MRMEGGVSGALFSPRSIALIGASADENKHTSLPQRYLEQHGYDGAIYPVNPHRDRIMGRVAYPSVLDINEPIDHAFVMVAAEMVPEAVAQCCAAGVRCATLLSAGFSEVGEAGRRLQERTLDIARKGSLRLVGPNSLGMVNFNAGITLTANEVFSLPKLPAGRNALISQSGSLLGALVSRGLGRGIGYSKMISVGNEVDLGVGEIGAMLVEDPDTDAILLFLETVRDAESMRMMARRAHEAGKPVIAFRLGRSAVGEQLAMSHTGALGSNGAAVDAFLSDIGVIRVDQIETLLETPALVAGRRPAAGGSVAVMSTTGGGGGLIVDALADRDIQIAAPDAEFIAGMAGKGLTISPSPLIDLTLAGTRADTYGLVLEELLKSPHCDAVVAVVGSSAEFRPDRAVRPILDLAGRYDKPLAVFLTPQAEQSHRLLGEAGVATFRTPESCADAMGALLRWRVPRAAPERDPAIGRLEAHLTGLPDGALDPTAAMAAVALLGVPLPAGVTLPADQPIVPGDLPPGLRFPVVAKVVSPDIQHKTEAGGIALGIGSPADLAPACEAMLATVRSRRPDARVEGVQIQSQERGLAEVLIGYQDDPNVGPMVTVGTGGVLAEIYKDFAVHPAPVDRATALEMIAQVRGLAPVRGYRSLPMGDLDALADALAAFSQLAGLKGARVVEAEINPLLVRGEGEGVVALDVLLVLAEDGQ